MNANELKALRRLSKSKMGTYKDCPYAFKLHYVDGREAAFNPFFQRGTDVHSFHEQFIKAAKIHNGKLIIPELKNLNSNAAYKKNIIRHHINRWKTCVDTKGIHKAPKYFYPIVVEEKITIPHLELTGVPDAIEWGFDDTPVAIEVKTGAPNVQKIRNYKNDLVWYKLLFEQKYSQYNKMNRGIVYFPENNYTYTHELTDNDVMELLKTIRETQKQIVESATNNSWKPQPSKQTCAWCSYRAWCDFKK